MTLHMIRRIYQYSVRAVLLLLVTNFFKGTTHRLGRPMFVT